jgi:peptidyl-prolyl cis-trans isomerase-like protein 2
VPVGYPADPCSLQDPFEEYKVRLAARIARQDQSEEAMRKRAEAQAERDKDRTTWLGTNLGEKGESKARKEERKRRTEESGSVVGKYLGAVGVAKSGAGATGAATEVPGEELEFGVQKKKRKAGGFGDFSGW